MADKTLLLIYETEEHCRARLIAEGTTKEHAIEISSYLAQSTDMIPEFPMLQKQCASHGITFVALPLTYFLESWKQYDPARTLTWTLTDGIAFFSGSCSVMVADAIGFQRVGSDVSTFVHCQDKFRTGAILSAIGIPTPASTLLRNGQLICPKLPPDQTPHGYFIKPNRLGSKIGIYDDSHCTTLATAQHLSRRIHADYADDAILQAYVPGVNVRASWLDVDGRADVDARLGMWIVESKSESHPGRESAAADFQTMRDSMALYGDTGAAARARGDYREPVLTDLRTSDPRAAAQIVRVAKTMMRVLGLRDVFSMDFRLQQRARKEEDMQGDAAEDVDDADDAGDEPLVTLIEFEVCPGLPCFDFRAYVRRVWGMEITEAMALMASRKLAAFVETGA